MKASENAHDWHCEDHGTYGWRGDACRQCPTAPSEAGTLRAALAELVALKDQKDAAEKEAEEARAVGACPSVNVQRTLRDYEERKPAAWAAARAALGPNGRNEAPAAPLAAGRLD